MNPITEALLRTGIISPEKLQEMKRFSPVIPADAETATEPVSLDLAVKLIADAVESESAVLIRETDLTVVKQYLETAQSGTLCVGENLFDVTYGRTAAGDFIIAWRGESIVDLMTDEATYLLVGEEDRVQFKDVRELFFGEQKAFMVCVPHQETDGHQ